MARVPETGLEQLKSKVLVERLVEVSLADSKRPARAAPGRNQKLSAPSIGQQELQRRTRCRLQPPPLQRLSLQPSKKTRQAFDG